MTISTFGKTALGCLLAAALAVGTVACGPNDRNQGGGETQGAGRGVGGPGTGGPAGGGPGGGAGQTATTVPPPR